MRIGIGAGRDWKAVLATLHEPRGRMDILCYTSPENRDHFSEYDVRVSTSPEEALVNDLADGKIDAAVRGSLPASTTLAFLKKRMGVDHLERIALLETADKKHFLLAPVGVDEGWTVEEKVSLVERAQAIAPSLGLSQDTAVLSGGRKGDVGRHPAVDRSIADAESVALRCHVDHSEILIEEAVKNHSIIIAPDGISGNLIFRTLVLLGGGEAHGAPVVNIDRLFVDTSRASPDYCNALFIAESLSDKKHVY